MRKLVINLTREPLQIDVRDPDGKLTQVQIMHRSRAKIAEGWTVDQNWLAHNLNKVKVVEPEIEGTESMLTGGANDRA